MAKKRYVGFKYESIDETEPGFDAKGIETVRRDGFPAGQKMVESVIKWVQRRPQTARTEIFPESSSVRRISHALRTTVSRNGANYSKAKSPYRILHWRRRSSWVPIRKSCQTITRQSANFPSGNVGPRRRVSWLPAENLQKIPGLKPSMVSAFHMLSQREKHIDWWIGPWLLRNS